MLRGCEVPANRDGSQVIDLRPVRARSHDFAVPVELCCGAAAGAAGEVRFALCRSVLHGAARCQLVAGGSFWLPCECAPDLSRAGDYTRRVAAVAAAGALVGVAVAVWFVRWARRPVGTRRQRRRAEQEKLVS